MSSSSDSEDARIAAAISPDFDPFSKGFKSKMAGIDLYNKKLSVREQMKNNNELQTKKGMELNISKGRQAYLAKDLREYYEKALEFVDVQSKKIQQKETGVKLLSSSKSCISLEVEKEEPALPQKRPKKRKNLNVKRIKKVKRKKQESVSSSSSSEEDDLSGIVMCGRDILSGGVGAFKMS